MNLYCAACDELHAFKPGEVEQIVYGLVDRLTAQGQAAARMTFAYKYATSFPCLRDVLESAQLWSDDGGNYDTVHAWVEKRRRM